MTIPKAAVTMAMASVFLLVSHSAEAQRRCTTSSDCNDDLFCNGEQYCSFFRCRTVPFTRPCTSDEICLEFEDECVPKCSDDSDCDDGLFCNGMERCSGSRCLSGSPPCLPGARCVEVEQVCRSTCPILPDQDGDGFDSTECGGADCDDSDPGVYPGNAEVCDAKNKDEDCDTLTFGDRDADSDGYIDALCCNYEDGFGFRCGNDCNDHSREMHPGHLDVCDGLDNNCSGFIDDLPSVKMYPDLDMDGFGDGGETFEYQCPGTPYFSPLPNDCDDSNPAIVPGAMVCDTDGEDTVFICGSDGIFIKDTCPGWTDSVCVTLPNGTAGCVPRKCIPLD